jgi:putative MATE family efflux protein
MSHGMAIPPWDTIRCMSRRSARNLSDRLVSGPIVSSLVRLAWPVMLSNLFQTIYNFTDRFWLAQHSAASLAAVGLTWPLIFLGLSIGSGVTIAGIALVSQYTGAQREEEANAAAGQVLVFTTSLSIVLAVVGFFAARPILTLMGPEPALIDAGTVYLRIIYAGTPLMFSTFIVTALLNGSGDTVTPMVLTAVSVLLNVGLDPFFIFGWGPFPEWGIAGAAAATVLSRGLFALVGFGLLFSGRVGLHIRWRHLRPHWGRIRQIISIGGMASVGNAGTALGFTIMNGALARIGTAAISAFVIGNSFIGIVLMPAMGLGQATATMVGQNLGAEHPTRAKKSAWAGIWLSSVILAAAAVFVLIFRSVLIRIFSSDPEITRIALHMFLIVTFAFPFMGIIQVVAGVYQGSGHTFYSMFFGLFRLWALRVPLVFILPFGLGMGADGIWWAMLASNFGTATLSLGFFLSGNWMRRVIKGASAEA